MLQDRTDARLAPSLDQHSRKRVLLIGKRYRGLDRYELRVLLGSTAVNGKATSRHELSGSFHVFDPSRTSPGGAGIPVLRGRPDLDCIDREPQLSRINQANRGRRSMTHHSRILRPFEIPRSRLTFSTNEQMVLISLSKFSVAQRSQ